MFNSTSNGASAGVAHNDKPLISVIIPVYNSEDYLPATIDSILAQSYQKWELILVDDGSSDASGTICDTYDGMDKRVRALHIPNGGRCHARNYGISLASGSYVTFCDNDDLYSESLLATVAEAISSSEVALDVVVYGRRLVQYSTSGDLVYESVAVPDADRTYCGDEIRRQYDKVTFGSDGVWCRSYRKGFLEENQICFDETLFHGAEDNLFNAHVAEKAQSVRLLPETLYLWQRREGHSDSMGISSDTVRGIGETLEIESRLMIESGLAKENPHFFAKRLLENMVFQIINVRYKEKPSFESEAELYSQLRELYRPYSRIINRKALPFSYRLEYGLLASGRFRMLYWLLLCSGRLRGAGRNTRASLGQTTGFGACSKNDTE